MTRSFLRTFLCGAFALCAVVFAPRVALASPTPIASCADLQAIGNSATGVYVLSNNIDCSEVVNFTPLDSFQGTLDGAGYAITDFSTFGGNYRGMFSSMNGATVRDLAILNANVVGNFVTGILAADVASSTISDVYIQGSIFSTAALSLAGGLAGGMSSSTVTNVRTNVDVTGYSYVGGMIGVLSNTSTIQSSFSEGTVTAFGSGGVAYAGGLIGQNSNSRILNSYSQTSVTASSGVVGGLVASHEGLGGYIEHSYARGVISDGQPNTGGLVGLLVGAASSTSSYWDTDTTTILTSATGTARTTVQMQLTGTFVDWDFATVWFEPSAGTYPLLRGFDVTAPTAPGTPTASSPTRYPPSVSWTASTDAGVGLAAVPYTIQWSDTADFSGTVYTSTTVSNTFFDATTLADGSWYYRVSAKDALHQTSGYVTSSAIIVDATHPTITLTGSSLVTVERGTVYTDAGATASDAIAGDLTSSIAIESTVNTGIEGTYTVTYTVADGAFNWASPAVRTVRVVFINRGGGGGSPSIQPAALAVSASGESTPLVMTVNESSLPTVQVTSPRIRLGFNADPTKVKGYAASLREDFAHTSIYPYADSIDYPLPAQPGTYVVYVKLYSITGDASPVLKTTVHYGSDTSSVSSTPESIAAQPTPEKPTSPAYQFTRNLRVGTQGEDVRELQKFLNAQGFLVSARGNGSVGKESTYFGAATVRALIRFQERYREQLLLPLGLTRGTGNFLNATRLFVNAGTF